MQPAIRHALLLAGGLGTRLRPLTLVRAKPAIPVAGEPLVRRIVRWLVAGGVDEVVLNLHHLPATLTAVVGDGSDLGTRVRYSWEQPAILGTAGGPRQALPIVGADRFLIVNGDTLTDVDIAALVRAHAASGALVTLALVPHAARYGGVRLNSASRVVEFVPRGPAAADGFHFVGVQVVEAEAFRSVRAGAVVNSIGGLYDDLIAARPGSIRGFVCEAAFRDIGTIADYWVTSLGLIADEGAWRGRRIEIHPTARVARSILWDDIAVGAGATLEECIVTDGVAVPAAASYRRSVLVRAAGSVSATPFDARG